jgi:hypothetical protein
LRDAIRVLPEPSAVAELVAACQELCEQMDHWARTSRTPTVSAMHDRLRKALANFPEGRP